MVHLQFIDYAIMLVYFLAIAVIGLYMARRQKSAADYFIAGRRVPVWAVAFTLMATMISSTSYIAHPGAVFGKNFYLMIPHLAVPIVLIFVVIFIVPLYRNLIRMSAYEYLQHRFGSFSRLYASLGFIILRFVDLGFTLYTTAIAASIMSGWPIVWIIVGLGIFTIGYTMIGGIEGVIWTDVIQGFILIGGAILILLTLLFGLNSSPSQLWEVARAGQKFSLGNPELSWRSLQFETPTIWIFLVAGLLNFGRSYICEQNMVQRYLVARSDRDAQKAAFIGALSCLPIWLLFMSIGAMMWAWYQINQISLPVEITSQPDNILPYFVVTQLPVGIIGLILAAILAAAQSTVSADLNSLATVVTNDYFVKLYPQAGDRSQVRVGRLSVLIAGLCFIVVSLLLTKTRAMAALEVGVTLVSIVAGGILGLFGLGLLTRRANRLGVNIAIAVCMAFTAWATITGPLYETLGLTTSIRFHLNPIMIGIFSHFLLFIVGYVASILTDRKLAPAELTIWKNRIPASLVAEPGASAAANEA